MSRWNAKSSFQSIRGDLGLVMSGDCYRRSRARLKEISIRTRSGLYDSHSSLSSPRLYFIGSLATNTESLLLPSEKCREISAIKLKAAILASALATVAMSAPTIRRQGPHYPQASSSQAFKLVVNLKDPALEVEPPINNLLVQGYHTGAGTNAASSRSSTDASCTKTAPRRTKHTTHKPSDRR